MANGSGEIDKATSPISFSGPAVVSDLWGMENDSLEGKTFTHVNETGSPSMVDVSGKSITLRQAIAEARVFLPDNVLAVLTRDNMYVAKGSVFHTAVLAGIMGAKKTSDLIPLCHPLAINKIDVDIQLAESFLVITCTVSLEGKTGVEMEALTGVSVAALTVYDMCKGLSHDIRIESIRLLSKTGGKSDFSQV